MNINFTGIKNPGYFSYIIQPNSSLNNIEFSPDEHVKVKYINMELTDKDWFEYNKNLSSSNVHYLTHPINPDFLNIGVVKGELDADRGTYFFLNGTQIDIEDGNLPIISFMAKMLKQLKLNPQNSIIDKNYYKSDIAPQTLMIGTDLRDYYSYKEDYIPDIKKYHNPQNISDEADKMLNLITNKMIDYFS